MEDKDFFDTTTGRPYLRTDSGWIRYYSESEVEEFKKRINELEKSIQATNINALCASDMLKEKDRRIKELESVVSMAKDTETKCGNRTLELESQVSALECQLKDARRGR